MMSMMISCQEAGRLLSEKMDRSLSLSERGKLYFHLSMCHVCTGMKRQFELIRRAAGRLTDPSDESMTSIHLSREAKVRLANLLKQTPG